MKNTWSRFATSLAALLAVSAPAFAGDEKPRRLESVTWDSVKHQLTWVISDGEGKGEGNYQPLKPRTYRIDMDGAVMTFDGEDRRFSQQEAKGVHSLMNLVAKYAIESTLWWEDGQGEKVDKQSPGSKPPAPRGRSNRVALDLLEKKLAALEQNPQVVVVSGPLEPGR